MYEVKEENVETMFQNIREYFDDKLKPKDSFMSSVLEPPSSVNSSFGPATSEECNIKDIDVTKSKFSETLSKLDILSHKKGATKKGRHRQNLKSMGNKVHVKKQTKVGPKSFSVEILDYSFR